MNSVHMRKYAQPTFSAMRRDLLNNACCAVLFASMLMSISSFSQTGETLDKVYPYWSARLHQGFVLIHSRDLRPIEDSYPSGIEIDLGWQRADDESWKQCHCLPK
ncbi:MAG TPA: hypothetical protein VJ917_00850, partial [Saprospiraceae bacterium]|nr:hypothetical protein [Saprospiraceae bacterium]